jgi:hypothetical protein
MHKSKEEDRQLTSSLKNIKEREKMGLGNTLG